MKRTHPVWFACVGSGHVYCAVLVWVPTRARATQQRGTPIHSHISVSQRCDRVDIWNVVLLWKILDIPNIFAPRITNWTEIRDTKTVMQTELWILWSVPPLMCNALAWRHLDVRANISKWIGNGVNGWEWHTNASRGHESVQTVYIECG